MTERRAMWVSMQVSIHVCISKTSFLGGRFIGDLVSPNLVKMYF